MSSEFWFGEVYIYVYMFGEAHTYIYISTYVDIFTFI